jgi:hypothetical protein
MGRPAVVFGSTYNYQLPFVPGTTVNVINASRTKAFGYTSVYMALAFIGRTQLLPFVRLAGCSA